MEKWRPTGDKTYHPMCEAFFTRNINKALVHDIVTALVTARDACEMETFMEEKDTCLRAELLECLAYVSMSRQCYNS